MVEEMWNAIPCFFFFGLIANVSAGRQCRTEVNIPGMALEGFVFKRISVIAPHLCDVKCEKEITCQSYNYVTEEKICELNNRTKEARPGNFRRDSARFYIRRLNNRVSLGSIPELPAQSCQEIKTSEGKETKSNKYWLDPTGTGTAVLVYCDMESQVLKKSCAELYKAGKRISGVYTTIDPDNAGPFNVVCDQTTAGGRWIVFQKRLDGSIDFYRGWDDYKRGFGNLNGEFWLGLDKIHRLTSDNNSMLRVDLKDGDGNTSYAEYGLFRVLSEIKNYELILGTYSGTAGDSLSPHDHKPFTTKDKDNDNLEDFNCAQKYRGAWWYVNCYTSNLNGPYQPGVVPFAEGVVWHQWRGFNYSLTRTEMKIRPANYSN